MKKEAFLTTTDVAELLGLKPRTVRLMAQQGKIKSQALPNRTRLFTKTEVERVREERDGRAL